MRITHLLIAFVIYSGTSRLWAQESDQPDTSQSDTEGIAFRIQDYVPGEFTSTLRWTTLNAAGSYSPSGWSRANTLPGELSLIDRYRGVADLKGGLNWIKHYENPRQVKNIQFNVYFNTQNRRSHEDGDPFSTMAPNQFLQIDELYIDKSTDFVMSFSVARYYYTSGSRFALIKPSVAMALDNGTMKQHRAVDILELALPNDEWKAAGGYFNEFDRNFSNTNIFTGIEFGLGIGRIYDGSQTYQTIEVLRTVEQLTGAPIPDHQEVLFRQLADILYGLKVKKYPGLDRERLFALDRTEQVMAVLGDLVGDAAKTPRIIAAVHDVLRFYPVLPRRFGSSIQLSLRLNAEYINTALKSLSTAGRYSFLNSDQVSRDYSSYWSSEAESRNIDRQLGVALNLDYSYFWPLNQDWQLNYSLGLNLERNWIKEYYRHDNQSVDSLGGAVQSSNGETEMGTYFPKQTIILAGGAFELIHIVGNRDFWSLKTGLQTEPLVGSENMYWRNISSDESEYFTLDRVWDYSAGRFWSEFNWTHSMAWQTYLTFRGRANLNYSTRKDSNDDSRDMDSWTAATSASVSWEHYF